MKLQKRGQASTELIVILGVALAILLAVFAISGRSNSFSRADFELTKGRAVVEDLANAADLVYRQGVGSKTKIYVNFPNNVNNITMSGSTLSLNIDAGGDKTVYRSLDFIIENGTITNTKGNKLLYVTAGEDFVYISENVSQEAQFCSNNNKDGLEDCDNEDFGGSNCYKQGFDEGNISCTPSCIINISNCSGAGTVPDSISDLAFDTADAYSIRWTWVNPSTPDFKESIVFINDSNTANTSNAFYTATGLEPNSTYTIIVHTVDYGNNINDTDVINVANSSVNNTTGNTSSFIFIDAVPIQDCNAEDEADKGTLDSSCDGTYPALCGSSNDLLSCNDETQETHTAKKIGATRYYGGVNITVYNSSVTDCDSIDTVLLCYEWWATGALGDCDISVDANGGSSYSAVTTTCPGETANPGVTCANVTGIETWACTSFFNSSGTRAIAKSEAQQAATGVRTISWDALYFNVTYAVVT